MAGFICSLTKKECLALPLNLGEQLIKDYNCLCKGVIVASIVGENADSQSALLEQLR